MSNPREVFAKSDAICFDVDSTVIKEEGIDELAKYLNNYEKVAKLTKQAMSGSMTFRESLNLRMNIINPSLDQIHGFLNYKQPVLSDNIKLIIDNLQSRNIPIYLISGGFRCIIEPIADLLKIPKDHIYANRLKFYYTGEYAGFDENQPTSDNGGKGIVIQQLKDKYLYKNLTLIGDGATDVEAWPPADHFIGFGGNIIREEVKAKSKWYITNFNELL